MLSPSLEDYLEELYRLCSRDSDIRIKDIAEILNVSMPSVVKGLKKLHNLGYINYIPYEKIVLLQKGMIEGKFLVQRNNILMDFVEVIGSECNVKDEAEAMEHYFTLSTIKAIEKLNYFFKDNKEIYNTFINYKHKSELDNT